MVLSEYLVILIQREMSEVLSISTYTSTTTSFYFGELGISVRHAPSLCGFAEAIESYMSVYMNVAHLRPSCCAAAALFFAPEWHMHFVFFWDLDLLSRMGKVIHLWNPPCTLFLF